MSKNKYKKFIRRYTIYFFSMKWIIRLPAKFIKTIRFINNKLYRIKRIRAMSFSQISSQMYISRDHSTLKNLKLLKDYSSNMILQSSIEKEIAYDVCDFINLKQHHDTFKSWDKLGFLSTIAQNIIKTH